MKKLIVFILSIILICPIAAEAKGSRGGGKPSKTYKTTAPASTPKTSTPKPTPHIVIPKSIPAKPVPVKPTPNHANTGTPVQVKPYIKKDGKVVAPHTRSPENKTRADNYSTKGNINPNTGKPGTKPVVKPIPKN